MSQEASRRPLFEATSTEEMWVEGTSQYPDSKVLVTISSALGERTVLITPTDIAPTKSKLFVQAPPERITTAAQQRNNRMSNIIKYLGYFLSAVLISFSVLSASGFMKARVVLTGSMEPTINPGDIVLLAPTPRTQPELGDIAAYTARRFSGESVGVFTHRIVGGGIVGTNAGDLIGEICLAVEMGADAADIGKTIHPHPTLCESVGMAAEVFEGVCTDVPPARKK
mgnify:CR=1 FL=1